MEIAIPRRIQAIASDKSSLLVFAGLLMFSLAPASAVAQSPACADFNQFKHGQTIPSETRVGNLWVSAFPANPIEIYDPQTDNGPAGATGAVMKSRLHFSSGDSLYKTVTISFVSMNPGATKFQILDVKGRQLRAGKLPAKPQLQVLQHTERKLKFANQILLDNGSGESIISRVCFSR
jgi:hypothetical protein